MAQQQNRKVLNIHNRRSIRLKGYDYSNAGIYYITICIKDRAFFLAIVQWFKTMTTNEYIRGVKNMGWIQFNGKLWQRNYWEHIIRDEKSYKTISNYIINNPSKWKEDKFHKQ